MTNHALFPMKNAEEKFTITKQQTVPFFLWSALFISLGIAFLSGIILSFLYQPNVYHAYSSIVRIESHSSLLRSIHIFSTQIVIAQAVLWSLYVLFWKGNFYKVYPKILFLCGSILILFMAFTGSLLPNDLRSFVALSVSLETLQDSFPTIGNALSTLLRNDVVTTESAIPRIFLWHTSILPIALMATYYELLRHREVFQQVLRETISLQTLGIFLAIIWTITIGSSLFSFPSHSFASAISLPIISVMSTYILTTSSRSNTFSFVFFPNGILRILILSVVLLCVVLVWSCIFPVGVIFSEFDFHNFPTILPSGIKPEWYFSPVYFVLSHSSAVLTYSLVIMGFSLCAVWIGLSQFFSDKVHKISALVIAALVTLTTIAAYHL